MKLYIARHAIAVDPGTPSFRQDSERPLTAEGRAQARASAKGLSRLLKKEPKRILTSPYLRALQTAEQISQTLGPAVEVRQMPELTPEARPAETSRALKGMGLRGDLVLVGHEPHLTSWLSELTASRPGVRFLLKKGGVVRGGNSDWIRDVYGFAIIPDIVLYLRVDLKSLLPRVIGSQGLDYWESGMDRHLGEDLYDSFSVYQGRLIREYEKMAAEFKFEIIDTSARAPEAIHEDLRARIESLVRRPRKVDLSLLDPRR